ncbi:NTP transferase domain-containing protein [Herbaspirillum chlorophenolicum]|uniref:NTP transferase domain-containing protein n=1 Tax=Herbaspirillum chlorophenolicum TaxID=211589 RepID=A0ABW8EYJ0_9BURK
MDTAMPAVLILAAGAGSRFRASGGTVHKLDAPLDGRAVLEHVLDAATASGLRWHLVRNVHGGMGDSIAAGVLAAADASGWLILPGDLPLVAPGSLRLVAQALSASQVVVPHWHGQRGHPVGFARVHGNALAALRGDTGAAALVQAQRALNAVLDLELDDEGIIADVDTTEDLARVHAILKQRQTSGTDTGTGEQHGKH